MYNTTGCRATSVAGVNVHSLRRVPRLESRHLDRANLIGWFVKIAQGQTIRKWERQDGGGGQAGEGRNETTLRVTSGSSGRRGRSKRREHRFHLQYMLRLPISRSKPPLRTSLLGGDATGEGRRCGLTQ